MRLPAGAPRRASSDRGERHADAEDVGEHVAGVGEQGQRAGGQADDELQRHEGRADAEGDPQPAEVLGAPRRHTVAVSVTHERNI